MGNLHDIIIKNTNIVDGTGKRSFTADIGIKGEKISSIGTVDGSSREVIDGTGLTACPGFLDVHNHTDLWLYKHPEAFHLVMQGITTFAGGNCGASPAPFKNKVSVERFKSSWGLDYAFDWNSFGEWLDTVSGKGLAVNYIPLVGHSIIRNDVLGEDTKRISTPEEIEAIKDLVEEAFESGAFGISTMLDPGSPVFQAARDELVEIVKISKRHNGVFVPHTRHHQNQWVTDNIEDERYGLFFGHKGEIISGRYHGLLEAAEISKSAGFSRLHIAHLTPAYIIPQPHPRKLDEAIARATLEDIIEKPANEGIDISFSVIPSEYSIGSEKYILDEFMSKKPWKGNMKKEEFISKLKDIDFREDMKRTILSGRFKFGMINPVTDPYWFDCFRITGCINKEYINKDLGEIVRHKYNNNTIEMVYNRSIDILFIILGEDPQAKWSFIKDKREYGVLETFLNHPLGMPGSDIMYPGALESVPLYGTSPLFYGMFIHFLRVMVKEKKVFTLEEAVRKITSLPAEKVFGIRDRGVIKRGAYADLVLMDFKNLRENEDCKHPHKTPDGIEYVFVNGKAVCKKNTPTGIRPGKVLRNN
jgi:N-acyl-D-aspartate/D-glutamate deacylase